MAALLETTQNYNQPLVILYAIMIDIDLVSKRMTTYGRGMPLGVGRACCQAPR